MSILQYIGFMYSRRVHHVSRAYQTSIVQKYNAFKKGKKKKKFFKKHTHLLGLLVYAQEETDME